MSLERLLDGLDVKVEPLVVRDVRRKPVGEFGSVTPATVHCTLRGSGLVELAGGATVLFSKHRVIVLPPRPNARVVPGSRVPKTVTVAAGGDRITTERTPIGTDDRDVLVACGRIVVTYQGSVSVFDHLQDPLVEHLTDHDLIRRCFHELWDEIAAQRPGSRAMTETLLRRCLVLFLRRCYEHGECRLSWLAALDDGRLGRAVAAMRDRPEYSFTLPGLAKVAGMSRSVFAARFADALGQSPIEFLKALRLTRAANLLTRTDMPVKAVAARVGYSSRSSFTRAFLAQHGVAPMAFRVAASEPVAASVTARRSSSETQVACGRCSPA